MVEKLLSLSFIKPILEKEAELKNLNVYLFNNEEIIKYYNVSDKNIGVILLAKDENNALFNLKNLRKCYAVNVNE
mgnify:FL=1